MQKSHISRTDKLNEITYRFNVAPVCGLIGPRQCGKTTLAKAYASTCSMPIHHFDLENEYDLAKLQEPLLTLSPLEGLIIIDEVHHAPNLFKTLRVLVDEHKNRKFLILGSASQRLLQQTSETLAGRISYIEMMPFSLSEVDNQEKLWSRGGFPLSYLAQDDLISLDWRRAYIKTFLELDILSLGYTISPQIMRRFWTMLAHYHGQIFNASEIGGSLGVNYKTAQSYLDLLDGTFMVRRLSPWFTNIKKRQIKNPKIYFRDSGLYHTLMGIHDYQALLNHPKLRASWEGFAMESIIRYHNAESEDCYFWGTQNGAELDLLITQENKKIGFEFKYTSSPQSTKSMHIAMEDLGLDALFVITPQGDHFTLGHKISAYGLNHYLSLNLNHNRR